MKWRGKLIATIMTSIVMISMNINLLHAKNNNATLTEEQIQVLKAFNETEVVMSTAQPRAGKTTYLERGSVVAWSKDYVRWKYNNGEILYSTAWQDTG